MKREKPDTERQRNPVEELAESFVDRHRRGEEPEISEYTERYPDLAEEIREVFPALLLVEQLGAKDNDAFAASSENSGTTSDRQDNTPLRRLGEYVIVREVGRGGMGVVYEAQQESLGRRVALKVLPIHQLMDERRLARFQREARAAASLRHPNIVPVFGVGNEEGIYYYTMQFIPGQGLDEVLEELRRLRRGERSPRATASLELDHERPGASTASLLEQSLPREAPHGGGHTRTDSKGTSSSSNSLLDTGSSDRGDSRYFRNVATLGVRIAEALAYAHGQGVLHRDIKPSNLLLEPSGRVWVTDFGLAKETDSGALTLSGEVVGTLAYMAPERLDGSSGPRSDVYSLGVTLYELLTLRPAFEDADRARLIKKVAEGEARPVRALEPQVPRDLETVVLKAMAKEPVQRYGAMDEFADDLKRFFEDRPVLAQRPTTLERAIKWSRRNKPAVAALGILLLLVATLAASMTVIGKARDEAEAQKERAEGLYLRAQSSAELSSSPDRALLLAIEGARRAPGFLSNNALLAALGALHERRTLFERSNVGSATFSPDGKRVLTLSSTHDFMKVWEVESGNPLSTSQRTRKEVFYALSPDGSRILTVPRGGGGGTAWLWDAETATEIVSLEGHPGNVESVLFSPQGHWALIDSADGTAGIWDTRTGSHLVHLTKENNERFHALGPGGNRVLRAMPEDDTARVWDANSGEDLLVFEDVPIAAAAFSSAGTHLAIAGPAWFDSYAAYIVNIDTGERLHTLQGHEDDLTFVTFSLDDTRVLTASWDKTARVFDAETGAELTTLKGHERRVLSVRSSADNERVVTASLDNTVRLWSPAKTHGSLALESHSSDVFHASFDAVGQRVVTASADGTAIVWDSVTGQQIACLTGHRHHVRSAIFSGDGKRVLTASEDGTARIWDANTGKELATLQHKGGVTAAVFSPSGGLVGTASEDFLVRIWEYDLEPAERSFRLEGHQAEVDSLGFDFDGKRLLTGSRDGTARIWDVETGAELVAVKHAQAIAVGQFSRDGTRILTGSDDYWARIWSADTGKELHSWRHRGHVLAGAFSPEGRRIITGTDDFSAQIWSMGTEVPLTLQGHKGRVTCVAFSPDGKRALTASEDRTARVWSVETGRPLCTLHGHRGALTSASFNRDGTRVVTSSADGTARIWPAVDYLAVALEARTRELTPEEMELFEIGTAAERTLHRSRWNARAARSEQQIATRRLKTRFESSPPNNVLPPEGTDVGEGSLVLRSSSLRHADAGVTHRATHWQVRTAQGTYDTSPAMDFLSEEHLESLVIPEHILLPGATYYWRVSHVASSGEKTEFSTETFIRTGTSEFEAVRLDLSPVFNRDVIADFGDRTNDSLDDRFGCFLERGFNGKHRDGATQGLPRDRVAGVHELGDYRGPNALQTTREVSESIRLTAPERHYSSIRFLVVGGNGDSEIPITFEYTDGTTQQSSLYCDDWFNDSPPDFTGAKQPWAIPIINGMDRWYDGGFEDANDPAVFEMVLVTDREKRLDSIVMNFGQARYYPQLEARFNLLAVTGIVRR